MKDISEEIIIPVSCVKLFSKRINRLGTQANRDTRMKGFDQFGSLSNVIRYSHIIV